MTPTVVSSAAPRAHDLLVQVLRGGGVAAVPTDTVYGLIVDAFNPSAIAKLFEIKGRPTDLALPILVSGLEQAGTLLVGVNDLIVGLAERFWPGALTIVGERRVDLEIDVGGDTRSIGVRAPADRFLLTICDEIGPLASTSANRHASSPLMHPKTIAEELDVSLVIDGGPREGLASTVISVVEHPPVILREGAISSQELYSVIRTTSRF